MCRALDKNYDVRRVRAKIETRDESTTYHESGFRWLDDKWGALSVYAPADGEQPEVWGKIMGFEWQARLAPSVRRSRRASPATFRPPNASTGG